MEDFLFDCDCLSPIGVIVTPTWYDPLTGLQQEEESADFRWVQVRFFRPSWHLNTRPPQKLICVCVGGHIRSRPAKIKHDIAGMRRAGAADDEDKDEVEVFTGFPASCCWKQTPSVCQSKMQMSWDQRELVFLVYQDLWIMNNKGIVQHFAKNMNSLSFWEFVSIYLILFSIST